MKSNLITKLMTLTFPDRVGAAAQCFEAAGRSRLNVLRLVGNKLEPHYVITMQLDGDAEAFERFEHDELPRLTDAPASILEVAAQQIRRAATNDDVRMVTVSVYAFDQRRLVADTTEIVRCYADLSGIAGSSYPAAESAAPLFLAELKARLLPHADLSQMEDDLARLADERGWDIRVWPFEPAADERRGFHQTYPPSRAALELDARADRCRRN